MGLKGGCHWAQGSRDSVAAALISSEVFPGQGPDLPQYQSANEHFKERSVVCWMSESS